MIISEEYNEKYNKTLLDKADDLKLALQYYIDRTNQLEQELKYYKKAYSNRIEEYLKLEKRITRLEEKDIKIIDEIIPDDLLNCWSGGQEEYEAIKKLLKAYKQDEKIIQEMANYIKNEWGFANNDEVIDYFRKRCK